MGGNAERAGCGSNPLAGSEQCLIISSSTDGSAHGEAPAFVQNRCYARLGWDQSVRRYCNERKIIYQGFSLLTANVEVLRQPLITGIAARENATPAQVIFAFARAMGMLPLTGTSSAEHMKQDLAGLGLTFAPDEVQAIEFLAG